MCVCVCVCVSVLHIHILLPLVVLSQRINHPSAYRILCGSENKLAQVIIVLLYFACTTEFSNYIVRNIMSYSIGKIMCFSSNYLPAVGKLGLLLCGAPGSLLSAGEIVTDSSTSAMSSRLAIPSLAFTSRNLFLHCSQPYCSYPSVDHPLSFAQLQQHSS